MAQTKNGSSGASKPTVAELRSWYDKNQKRLGNYELAENQVKRLRDVTKNASGKSISAFNKDTVITYLQSPGNNEKNLRNLSRYLYYRSNIYFRICEFFSNMPMLNARQVVPKIDLSKGMDQKKALKSYNQTLELIDRMNLVRNFKKVFSTVFREDVFYGLYWIDDTGMIIIRGIRIMRKSPALHLTARIRLPLMCRGFEADRIFWNSGESLIRRCIRII